MNPRLGLARDVRITSRGLVRGTVEVAVTDPFLVGGLRSGVDVAEVTVQKPLTTLHKAGMLAWRLPGLIDVEVLATGVDLALPGPDTQPVRLSRFAVLHQESGEWLLDSGLSPWRARLTAAGVAEVASGEADGWFGGLLTLAGMSDIDDSAAAAWSVPDRWFLSCARGRLAFTGPPPMQRGVAAEPAFREFGAGIALPRPDGPEPDEPSLWQATEGRRTCRDFLDRPVSLRALGHLLWRTLRVQQTRTTESSYDAVLRPVPSGGAMHATDLWLFCRDVEGLPPGAYGYDPLLHRLVAAGPLPVDLPAPIAGLLTTRHRRTAWKYEPSALSLELQDVGVQWMALQLAGSVLGLGVVPLGGGSGTVAADVLGLDPLLDAPVGEFLVGVVE